MQTEIFIIWLLEIIVLGAALFAVQLPLRQRNTKAARIVRVCLFPVKLFGVLLAALSLVAFDSEIAYQYGDILAALYIVLMGDVIADIIALVIGLTQNRANNQREHTARQWGKSAVLFACCCAGFFLYGFVNAGQINVVRHNWPARGITRPHTFAFAADLHVGSAQSMDALKALCAAINRENPEFVILGGDITDELTSRDEMAEAYRILSTIKAPVYFIYGNHDRQVRADLAGGRTYDDRQLTEAIRQAGIRVLTDDYVKIDDELILLGREDISAGDRRKPYASLVNPYQGGALIVADHQPYDEEQLNVETAALQLSGHTHAGQLWPLRMFYRYALNLPAYGEFEMPRTRLYVSAGANDWQMPIRTEARCEWELVTLTPAK